jgi:hypothetical protein
MTRKTAPAPTARPAVNHTMGFDMITGTPPVAARFRSALRTQHVTMILDRSDQDKARDSPIITARAAAAPRGGASASA